MKRKHKLFAAVLAVLSISLVASIFFLERWHDRQAGSSSGGKTVEEMLRRGSSDGLTDELIPVYYNGKEYVLNPDIQSILILGVDSEGMAESTGRHTGAGQADFLLLLVLDDAQMTMTAIHINRDTMTQIETVGITGSPLGAITAQIALAYAYGDSVETSCENTVRAVSNLFYGVQIDEYISLRASAVSMLNDAIGGVTVTIEDDFSQVDPTLIKGETMTLMGEQAARFVSARFKIDDESNLSRMNRQRYYLTELGSSLTQLISGDMGYAFELYTLLDPYMTTSLSGNDIGVLANRILSLDFTGIITPEGEARMGDLYIEFYPDEESIIEMVLTLFYTEQS